MQRSGIKENIMAQGIINPRLLPLKDAANLLGLTLWALRERIWAGQIPVVRFPGGRKMYIDSKDIDQLVERNKETIA
jgi:predicted site-specific integrase-resolvase